MPLLSEYLLALAVKGAGGLVCVFLGWLFVELLTDDGGGFKRRTGRD